MKIHRFGFPALLVTSLFGQGLDPAKLMKLSTDTWHTYNGDYSGRRFSPLARIDSSNVTAMTLAWEYRINTGPADGANNWIKSTLLEVNGVLYFTIPHHPW